MGEEGVAFTTPTKLHPLLGIHFGRVQIKIFRRKIPDEFVLRNSFSSFFKRMRNTFLKVFFKSFGVMKQELEILFGSVLHDDFNVE
jgi:hypothetical protein